MIGYGATSGELFLRGVVGERFCVRNSGATAVAEGTGDHGCEYMTGGRVAVLGPVGRNFAAGMSGGLAYLLDPDPRRVNTEMADLEPLDASDASFLRGLLERHLAETGSTVAARLLTDWDAAHGAVRRGGAEGLQAGAGGGAAGRARGTRRERGRDGRGDRLSGGADQMADPKGFLTTPRRTPARRPVDVRIQDWREVYTEFPARELELQAGRCMDCGIPFCHHGCPLGNLIPEWNDLVWRQDWQAAAERLHATNNFPEFTGRLCPAPCESACVLGINADPVTIKQVEVEIIDRALAEGWVVPQPPSAAALAAGRKVAVIGSGPAGLAAAQQLTRAGHAVTVYEREEEPGGLLRFGIPEFKLEKRHLDRRLGQLRAEGTVFRCGVGAGVDVTAAELRDRYDAIVLAGGATVPRGLPVPGAGLDGIHQAMEYLPVSNRAVRDGGAGAGHLGARAARGHHRRRRHRGRLPRHRAAAGRGVGHPAGDHAAAAAAAAGQPAVADLSDDLPGVQRPRRGRRAYLRGQHAGIHRGRGGPGAGRCGWSRWNRPATGFAPVPGTERELPVRSGAAGDGLRRRRAAACCSTASACGSTRAATWPRDGSYATPVPGVFVAGDMGRGQSLIVWAIAEGRSAAAAVDATWPATTDLPGRDTADAAPLR